MTADHWQYAFVGRVRQAIEAANSERPGLLSMSRVM
jgi:hypothetical protein